jgi:hypothetical protein
VIFKDAIGVRSQLKALAQASSLVQNDIKKVFASEADCKKHNDGGQITKLTQTDYFSD